jgi:transposase-like protein
VRRDPDRRQRRWRWSTTEKICLIEEGQQPGSSVSFVAHRYGISPRLLFPWKRSMLEGSHRAANADEEVVSASRVRELERRVRNLARLLGRKTTEFEFLKETFVAGSVHGSYRGRSGVASIHAMGQGVRFDHF